VLLGERLVDPAEVVVHVEQAHPDESAHPHPHREVLALDVAVAGLRKVGVPGDA
jgi:hypothetical protein